MDFQTVPNPTRRELGNGIRGKTRGKNRTRAAKEGNSILQERSELEHLECLSHLLQVSYKEAG